MCIIPVVIHMRCMPMIVLLWVRARRMWRVVWYLLAIPCMGVCVAGVCLKATKPTSASPVSVGWGRCGFRITWVLRCSRVAMIKLIVWRGVSMLKSRSANPIPRSWSRRVFNSAFIIFPLLGMLISIMTTEDVATFDICIIKLGFIERWRLGDCRWWLSVSRTRTCVAG